MKIIKKIVAKSLFVFFCLFLFGKYFYNGETYGKSNNEYKVLVYIEENNKTIDCFRKIDLSNKLILKIKNNKLLDSVLKQPLNKVPAINSKVKIDSPRKSKDNLGHSLKSNITPVDKLPIIIPSMMSEEDLAPFYTKYKDKTKRIHFEIAGHFLKTVELTDQLITLLKERGYKNIDENFVKGFSRITPKDITVFDDKDGSILIEIPRFKSNNTLPQP